ncbi:hypothetical protein J3R82DRAFT_6370 [Butyriboletus roseoflavus]|nr:hypothetical protein J3R82DRAFT_6370 [Butyriboletus roseoflavus]
MISLGFFLLKPSASFQARVSAKVHLTSTLMILPCREITSPCPVSVVADMLALPLPSNMYGPIPTVYRARKQDCIVWAEIEARAYMFGAMRNGPDPFVEAFLRELRARPDLFQVVLRSETAPGREVEVFGSGPLNNEALPAIRCRDFEAPPSWFFAPTSTSDEWKVTYSAVDALYEAIEREEHLRLLERAVNWPPLVLRLQDFPGDILCHLGYCSKPGPVGVGEERLMGCATRGRVR